MTYTLTVADRSFGWSHCNGFASDPASRVMNGGRVLSPAELDGVIQTLEAVTVSSATGCGFDKSEESLTITTSAGTQEYWDDFHACEKKGTYVANVDPVFQALSSLAP